MSQYIFKDIEAKWQNLWADNNLHRPDFSDIDKKFYALTMFCYPSGDKLHVGHWYAYGPPDTFARFMKMQGYNVFQPQGFDSFGLPAENYAIKHGIHPAESTKVNVDTMRAQLNSIGAMYDWKNEVNTSTPEYYKWTQWLFLKLYEKKLAYQKTAPVNWCPSCATVLANEQVKEGKCERCKEEVTKRNLTQWFFKITNYAEELLQKLDDLDWPEKTKHMQRNWIGKSIGANIHFKIKDVNEYIEVFTTRSDTIFGTTYLVLAPEHTMLDSIVSDKQKSSVHNYIEDAKKSTEIERTSLDRKKTGVFTGAYAINPINQTEIPIWVADYVIISYGTGAIMAVPSGDERDFEFANEFKLPIIEVVSPDGNLHGNDQCFNEHGISVNSGEFSGKDSKEVINLINERLKELGLELEAFGKNEFLLRSVPAILKNTDNEKLLRDTIELLPKGGSEDILHDKYEDVLIMMSCRNAIKVNHPLNLDQIRKLVSDLEQTSMPFTCPHGRPIALIFEIDDILKKFLRK